jgi:hypothetical protein
MGSIKQKTVSKLMDVAKKIVDGKDTYHNKRTRSLEDDRSHHYNNQKPGPVITKAIAHTVR